MTSRKRSAQAKQIAEFKSHLGGMDDLFAHEERRRAEAEEEQAARTRSKACSSKNRYASRGEAMAAIEACADYGRTGLQCYHCPYCDGWHLTSHPWD